MNDEKSASFLGIIIDLFKIENIIEPRLNWFGNSILVVLYFFAIIIFLIISTPFIILRLLIGLIIFLIHIIVTKKEYRKPLKYFLFAEGD